MNTNPNSTKAYLGDGVYVEVERGMIRLTTSDGIRVLNEIYLEPEVWSALMLYAERLSKGEIT